MDDIVKINLRSDNQFLFILPILEDNYAYVLSWNEHALVVDPGEGKCVLDFVESKRLKLTNILITHYHEDHTGGSAFLKKKTDCCVIGPEDKQIPELEHSVADHEELIFGPFTIVVIAAPGHTKSHVVYFFHDLKLLFSGDLIFGAGCGRLFEGSAEEMWHSLQKIMVLPDETSIFFGHEYTLKNLEFAHHIEPGNQEVVKRLEKVRKMRAEGQLTVPTTLDIEKKTNPFLRAETSEIKEAVGMSGARASQVFAHLRILKDSWG